MLGAIPIHSVIVHHVSIGETRWDEKAGLQTGCCTLPSYLSTCSEAQEIKETGNEEG